MSHVDSFKVSTTLKKKTTTLFGVHMKGNYSIMKSTAQEGVQNKQANNFIKKPKRMRTSIVKIIPRSKN